MMKFINNLRPQKDLSDFIQGYSGFRPDIIKLINTQPSKILDVGCGAGLLAKEIKSRYPNCKVTGLEADPELAIKASEYCDQVIQLNLNSLEDLTNNLLDKDFDLIILADILEHLIFPEKILNQLKSHLSQNGHVITSLPNIRHYSTFVSLYIMGRWPQNSRGIHDSTHLQFFTKKNIVNLLEKEGLDIEKESRNVRLIESLSWTNIPGKLLDFWPFRPFFTFQYLHRCKKSRLVNEP